MKHFLKKSYVDHATANQKATAKLKNPWKIKGATAKRKSCGKTKKATAKTK